jgi:nucleotide-binding universal stress UspA family protein
VTCITACEGLYSTYDTKTAGMSNFKMNVHGDGARHELQVRRILVPTDFSAGARRALECARAIAAKFQAKVVLLHVIPSGVFEFASPETSCEALAKAKEFAQQQLHRLMSECESCGIAQEGIVEEGPIGGTISEAIKSYQIDLVTVGTHGKSNSKKLVLGSVAEEIYRMADCPILTVPPQIESPADRGFELRHLLFATNFKPHNERAASIAHMLECRQIMKLTVLHVIEDSTESSLPSQKLVEEFMIKRMHKLLPEGCLENCKPEFAVRFGKPVEEILATAKQRQSNLILLGLRAAQRTAGHLPSAVAYSIVCQAACPVLTLHQ